MKHIKWLYLFVAGSLLLCSSVMAWDLTGTLTQWDTTPLRPYDIEVLNDGSVWLTNHDPSSTDWPFGKIYKIDPADGSTTVYTPPPPWVPIGFSQLVKGASNTLWITDQEDRIIHFHPGSASWVAYSLTAPTFTLPATPSGIALAPDGSVWFTCTGDRCLGRLDPGTGTFQRFAPLPADELPDHPNQITVGPDGIVWFTVGHAVAGRLGRLDPATGNFTLWDTFPVTGAKTPYGVIVLEGMVWFLDHQADRLVRYNPSTGVFTAYNTLPDMDDSHFLVADPDGIIWFTGFVSDAIGTFDPETETFNSVALASGANPMGIALSPNGQVWWAETYSMGHGGAGRFIPDQPVGITIEDGATWYHGDASMDLHCLRLFIKDGGTFNLESGTISNCGRIVRDSGGTLIRGTGTISFCGGFLPATMLLLDLL